MSLVKQVWGFPLVASAPHSVKSALRYVYLNGKGHTIGSVKEKNPYSIYNIHTLHTVTGISIISSVATVISTGNYILFSICCNLAT